MGFAGDGAADGWGECLLRVQHRPLADLGE
jgi:hypothetical protein